MQVEREHYLRDDISSGSALDPTCHAPAAKLSADAQHYMVVDTNIVLQQASPRPSRLPLTLPQEL
jgi:exosome complex exonuclease DIS3/RRP44